MITFETIKSTQFSEAATIVNFDYAPSDKEIKEMLNLDDCIVVEF